MPRSCARASRRARTRRPTVPDSRERRRDPGGSTRSAPRSPWRQCQCRSCGTSPCGATHRDAAGKQGPPRCGPSTRCRARARTRPREQGKPQPTAVSRTAAADPRPLRNASTRSPSTTCFLCEASSARQYASTASSSFNAPMLRPLVFLLLFTGPSGQNHTDGTLRNTANPNGWASSRGYQMSDLYH
jgi:hypothetical protein